VSEEIIGKAIKKYNIPRQKLVILSKCQGYVSEDISVRGFFYSAQMRESKDYVNQAGELQKPSKQIWGCDIW
jgi:aryl-alcohol dehydrogenase-like predicted oxidoreductase